MKRIYTFWLLCAILGFTCGVANAQSRDDCFMAGKVAHDAYIQATFNPQTPDIKLLHYMVDWWGDLQTYKHDREVAHRAVEYLAKRMKESGLTRAYPAVVYEATREFMIRECLK